MCSKRTQGNGTRDLDLYFHFLVRYCVVQLTEAYKDTEGLSDTLQEILTVFV